MSFEEHVLDPSVEYIKIYGLQRSGTNFVASVLNENFQNTKVLVNLGGWKHGYYAAPWILGQEVHVLVVAKNPYAWLVSVYEYWTSHEQGSKVGPDLFGVPFSEFVTNRLCLERQQENPFLYRASNPVQHWNNMYYHWMSVYTNEKKTIGISYESFLTMPLATTDLLGNSFGLKRTDRPIYINPKILEPGTESMNVGTRMWDRHDYYHRKDYLNYYTPSLLNFVNSQLDLEVMVMFGYEYEGVQ